MVFSAGATVDVEVAGSIHHASFGKLELVAGDRVRVRLGASDARVVERLPRRTELARLGPADRAGRRAIAANLDAACVVVSLVSPPFRPRLIDRYLAAIWQGGIEPVICLNKADLGDDATLADAMRDLAMYADLGIPVVATSTERGTGLPELARVLRGRTVAFVGHSGVGKSTLLNALVETAGAKTGQTSDYSKRGRHTTTGSRLYGAPDGTRIVDTPGVREFRVDFANADEVREAFPEFRQAAPCRYRDCRHLSEPDCGVHVAVREGRIARTRYRVYRKLVAEFVAGVELEGEGRDFVCEQCGAPVSASGGGTEHRNHCPKCLHSKHLDANPGDRAAACGGTMEPVAVWVRRGGEWALIHRCRTCGQLSSNRVAADDNEMLLMSLAVRALSNPPFPLERIAEMR